MRRFALGLVLVMAGVLAACSGGGKETKADWKANIGKPCFADQDCGGGLFCLNPGEQVGSGAAVDPNPPPPTEPPPPPAPPPETPQPCDQPSCEGAGGRCVGAECLHQGTCEPPPV
jgi:hypothetical protein